MEYFDFDQAARENDVAFDCSETIDSDLASLVNGENIPTSTDDAVNTAAAADETASQSCPALDGPWPMYRASEKCFFCRSMGLDCFVAQRGALQNGCTCCIALYRECSFTNARPREEYLETLHVVGEDSYVPTGSLTGKRALKSYRGPSTSTLLEESEQRGRKNGSRFPREAVRVLRSWLSDHTAHPYPTDEEKDQLKAKTGLKRSQICNWLANARRRGKVRQPPRSASPSIGVPIPARKLSPGVHLSDLNPLERWKHSPPENEPASVRDIIQAMATTPFHSRNPNDASSGPRRSNSRRTGSSNDDSSLSNVRPAKSSSGYSMDTAQSSISDMSFASVFSHRSSRSSFGSADTRDRRRRRHKSAVGQNVFQKSRAARIYQCTFCTDSFPTKYDWQRHEKSLHLALDKWTCAPQGGIILENGEALCAFCRQPNPDEGHLESHNYTACQEKSTQERTFYRKDHLNQHLRLMHNVKLGPWMDQWKSATTELKSRCGFCSATFTTWKDRVDHLAAHFKAGTEMSQWKGDWGFDPCIQRCVEGAMPPYLIAEERNSMNPWIAQRPSPAAKEAGDHNAGRSSANIPVPNDASCFRRLEIEVSAFIGRMAAQGIVPTDGMIQAEARRIIYGTDDPWNQTCADNPTWLAILKRDAGIYDLPGSQSIQLGDLGMQPPFAANGGLRRAPAHSLKAAPPPSNSSGLQSPAIPGSGFHSAVASHRGSHAGSLSGSVDFSAGAIGHGSLDGLPTSTMIGTLSSSAPVTLENDPLIEMGFDADFVQHLDDDYGDIGHELDDLHLEKFGQGGSGFQGFGFSETAFNVTATSAPSQLHATSGPPVTTPFGAGYQKTFDSSSLFSNIEGSGH
ncbi:conserved hypothetical protein [Uncinocarpus reesii 1704]|uniref:Homeobox and C2H2 transcription factor n=1 Tax=Uncinocarpus reesii (strain UAMH 1704) TaxID=336963 RepID=C4JYA7_UNCRE|nr:uncharacterized protein UREG_07158 [Uncinocarpus reesii 1704]EEP82293.1 conserved hypothetical protein [Uncinocarpus reesii 1704]